MTLGRRLIILFAMLLAGFVFLMETAHTQSMVYAQETEEGGSPPKGQRLECANVEAAKGGVLLGYIVPCVAYTIERGTIDFSKEMIAMLRPLFYSFLTFVIVMFGLKVLQGEGEVHKHGMLLLLKIGIVIAFLDMIPGTFVPAVYNIMNESQTIVAGVVGSTSSNIHCDIERYGDTNTPLVWAQMDCVLGKLYGFTTGADSASGQERPNMLLASSMVGLLAGFFFGGTFGVMLFFMCIGVLWSLFMIVFRVAFAFLNAYLTASIFLIIAPLFMPLVFLQVTGNYFQKWWNGILAAMLLPVAVTAYAMFALLVYDKLLFADDSLMNEMLDHDFVQQAQGLPRQLCNRELTNDPSFRGEAAGKDDNSVYSGNPFLLNKDNPLLSGANNLCAGLNAPVFDPKNGPGTEQYENNREIFEQLFYDATKLFILAWLINAGYKTMIGAIRPVLGSPPVTAALDATSPLEKRLQTGVQGMREGISNSFAMQGGGSASGADFIARAPDALRGAFTGFSNGISRNQG